MGRAEQVDVDSLREEVVTLKRQNKEFEETVKTQQIEMSAEMRNLRDLLTKQKGSGLGTERVDERKESVDVKEVERRARVRQWVFGELEFGKSELESIYNKLINDGFDDISLLTELNDDTLKAMGIHKRGDRIKILRACRSIQNVYYT